MPHCISAAYSASYRCCEANLEENEDSWNEEKMEKKIILPQILYSDDLLLFHGHQEICDTIYELNKYIVV